MEVRKGKWRSLMKVLRSPWEEWESQEYFERSMWVKCPSPWFDDLPHYVEINIDYMIRLIKRGKGY